VAGHSRPFLRFLVAGLVLSSGSDCAIPLDRPPAMEPPAAEARPRNRGVRLETITVESRHRGQSTPAPLTRQTLIDFVEASLPPSSPGHGPGYLQLDATMSLERRRTYFLDVVAIYPGFGVFPFTPEWGTAHIFSRVTLTLPEGEFSRRRAYSLELDVSVPYSVFWYSWYRQAPQQQAMERAWQLWAKYVISRLQPWLKVEAPASMPASVEPSVLDAPLESDPDFFARSRRYAEQDRRGMAEWTSIGPRPGSDGEGWHLITTPRQNQSQPRSWLMKYLSALSGLEAGYFMGSAWVNSEAEDSSGKKYTVATGDASSRGFRLSAYSVPEKSDWFVFPTLGFLWLDIDIHDFRQKIPMVDVPGTQNIEAVGSDPLSGAPIDLTDPNVYRLELRSGYLGQRLGGTLVFGSPRVQLFATLEGGLNLLEVRHTRSFLGKYTTAGFSAAFFGSLQLRGVAGIAIRPWHIALRCEANYEHYWGFEFDDGLNFEGRVEYDPENKSYGRPNAQVKAANAGTANILFSVNFYY
jgi:hypothetical protein